MPAVRRSRTIAASPQAIWELVADPHNLPRWWPRVTRVEGVEAAAFTQVLTSSRGKAVRADYSVEVREPGTRLLWRQQLQGTPFAKILRSCEIELALAGAQEGRCTALEIELRQVMQRGSLGWIGWTPRLGAWLVRRAGKATIAQALDGVERCLAG